MCLNEYELALTNQISIYFSKFFECIVQIFLNPSLRCNHTSPAFLIVDVTLREKNCTVNFSLSNTTQSGVR